MIDITKDEFWDNRNEEVVKKERKASKLKDFIAKHKSITLFLILFSLLNISNIILIYNFFRILSKL